MLITSASERDGTACLSNNSVSDGSFWSELAGIELTLQPERRDLQLCCLEV